MKKVFNLVIVDESGSMWCIREQAFTGINETLSTIKIMQEKFPDTEQHTTLVTFDTEHTTWHFDDALTDQVRKLQWDEYNPGSGTPLYDAIGNAISKVEKQAEEAEALNGKKKKKKQPDHPDRSKTVTPKKLR